VKEDYTYTGEICCCGMRSGFGFCSFKNGNFYRGQWKKDQMDGYGVLTTKTEVYQGEFKNDLPDGFIECKTPKDITLTTMKNGSFVEGEVLIKNKEKKYVIETTITKVFFETINQTLSCFGTINDYQGNLYEGELHDFKPFGWGTQISKGKFVYKGQQDKGFTGYGELFLPDTSKYFGFFKNSKKHGIILNFNVKEERIIFAKYLGDSKNGATLNVYKNGIKVEIWHDGYRVKLLENFELAKKYIQSCYPEHEWIINLDYMALIKFYEKLKL